MHFDHVAEELQQRHFEVWLLNLSQQPVDELVTGLIQKHCPSSQGQEIRTTRCTNGSLHALYRVQYGENFDAVLRFAILGQSIWRVEKMENEITILQYLRKHTNIPVPRFLGGGACTPLFSPYMIEDFIEGDTIDNICKDRSPGHETKPAILWSGISERDLRSTYSRMARLVLELSKCEFPRIGALVSSTSESGNQEFTVGRRPMTYNMNQLAGRGNLPQHYFPTQDTTFSNSREYFSHLTTLHLEQLCYQRNDAVTDEADCRRKFVARYLFRRIVDEKLSFDSDNGPFVLWCDDFRPSNVMLSLKTLQVSGVIDWEFAYAAPVQFVRCAPWWLLLQSPEAWEGDLREFMETQYMPRLKTWLSSLREVEKEMTEAVELREDQHLSRHMEESMTNGWFWVCIAARYSSMFDDVYWEFLDELFFGPFTSLEDRDALLSEDEKKELEGLYGVKQKHAEAGEIDDNYSAEVLFWI